MTYDIRHHQYTPPVLASFDPKFMGEAAEVGAGDVLMCMRSTPVFRRTRLAINHQARSAVLFSVTRIKSELNPAKIVHLQAY